MAHVDSRILNNKNRRHNDTDESHRHNDKQKKPDTVCAAWFHLHKTKSTQNVSTLTEIWIVMNSGSVLNRRIKRVRY